MIRNNLTHISTPKAKAKAKANPDAIINRANKLMSPWYTQFSCFYDIDSQYEAAAELYVQAANIYKIKNKFGQAGDTFMLAVNCYSHIKQHFYAIKNYTNASECYIKNNDTIKAISVLKNCLAYSQNNLIDDIKQLASIEAKIASIYFNDNMYEDAIIHYNNVVNYYYIEGQESLMYKYLEKLVECYIKSKNYVEAHNNLKKLENYCYDKTILFLKVNSYMLKSFILRIILVDISQEDDNFLDDLLETYIDNVPLFKDALEYVLLKDIINILLNDDIKNIDGRVIAFQKSLKQFDNKKKLDDQTVTILLELKKQIEIGKFDCCELNIDDLS